MINGIDIVEQELLTVSLPIELCEGEYLFHQNDIPESIYFILKGEVLAVYADGSKKLISCKELHGIRDIIIGEPYIYSAMAINDVKLKIMDKNLIMPILNKNRMTIIKNAFSFPSFGFWYE
ncbi:MAG: cyclic nucleotide-binding domain-containing protein [Cytophagales bacterium]